MVNSYLFLLWLPVYCYGCQGRGTTINVVLVNGTLHVGDQIFLCGTQASNFYSNYCIIF